MARAARKQPQTDPLEGQSGVVSETPQNPTQLVQETITGSRPDLQGVPGAPGTRVTSTASILDEYVSAGGFAWYANLPRSLTWAIDDVTRDLGDDLYNRMLCDAKAKSLIDDFKAAVLEDGLTLLPRISDEDDPQHADAQDLVDWCQDALDRLEDPLEAILWNMLDAVAFGNKVAEIVWQHTVDKDGKRVLFPRVLKVKPRHATSFVVDAYFNVLGFLVLVPGMMTVVQPDQLFTSLDAIPNFVPREKFLMLTFRKTDSDPRGVSILRAAYNAWNLKMQVWPEWLKYLVQFASPSLIGFTAPDAEAISQDQYGNQVATISPEQAMANNLANFRNGAVLAFPAESKVQPIDMNADGTPFDSFMDRVNAEMADAVFGATLSTEQGKHQTRAATGMHTDLKDMLIRIFKPVVAHMLRTELLAPMLRYNRPAADLKLLPRVSLSGVEESDFSGMGTAIAALETAGFLGESQKVGIDRMLGLPPRDTQADAQADAQAAATALEAAKAAHAPTSPETGTGTPSPAPTDLEAPGATTGASAIAPNAQKKGAA